MERKRRLSRRQFLVGALATLGGSALTWAQRPDGMLAASGLEPELTPAAYLPFVARKHIGPPYPGKVVHIHSQDATRWAGESSFWDYVDQDVVTQMVNRGLMELTGRGTPTDAWRSLLPAYQPGEKIAIKVNLNNTRTCDSTNSSIDALIQPVNAVVDGLVQIGVSAADICVFDAVRAVPDRLVDGEAHGVTFFDGIDGNWHLTTPCRTPAEFTYVPETRIQFHHPLGDVMPEVHVTDVVMNATYLINMPIMKGSHGYAGVTLGAKNYFGSLDFCSRIHDHVNVVWRLPAYRDDYNPLVDLIRSPLLGGKTVLTVGDGLFAARDFQQPPEPWVTFGDKVPNSLFFAKDPVSIDCVMHDLLAAEQVSLVPDANNYLRLAGEAGLGVFEQGDPWQEPDGSGYQRIHYRRIEI
jgi:hypothetical protein